MTGNDGQSSADTVGLAIEDGIAVVRIDNPPVNAVSEATYEGLAEAFATIEPGSSSAT